MTKYIIDGDFVEITTNKFKKANDVEKGRLAYVAGHRALPISEQNPYTQRIKFFVHLLVGDEIKPELGLFLMDPKSLKKLDEKQQEYYKAVVEKANNEDAAVN